MMAKLSAAAFARFLTARCDKHDGYIMGARGEDPKRWKATSWWFTQYKGAQRKKARYWREHAERVWDCQGMSEGYINQETGSNIDVRARNNYSSWCNPKGKGTIPSQYRVPGAAVFKAYASGEIHHVGYLEKPVKDGHPDGDWYIVEAKGVMYGVARTKLSDGGWNRWGWMTKYFDYSETAEPDLPAELGYRTLKRGDTGEDVREVQSMLLELDYDLGKYGIDGDFGPATEAAVKSFQRDRNLNATGVVDEGTLGELLDMFEHSDDLYGEADAPAPMNPDYAIDALDLSSHNAAGFPKIDWDEIARNVGFLILRAGCTRVKTAPLGVGPDVYFERFAKSAACEHIPFWAYYYSNPKSLKQAREEAEYLYAMAHSYNPVGYAMDCEEASLKKPGMIGAFVGRLRELTDKPIMLYIGHNWYRVYNLPTDADGFVSICDAVWIPRYGKNYGTVHEKYLPKYPCDLWQYTSKAGVHYIPDKTLDANIVTGQRRTIEWFRGE